MLFRIVGLKTPFDGFEPFAQHLFKGFLLAGSLRLRFRRTLRRCHRWQLIAAGDRWKPEHFADLVGSDCACGIHRTHLLNLQVGIKRLSLFDPDIKLFGL